MQAYFTTGKKKPNSLNTIKNFNNHSPQNSFAPFFFAILSWCSIDNVDCLQAVNFYLQFNLTSKVNTHYAVCTENVTKSFKV